MKLTWSMLAATLSTTAQGALVKTTYSGYLVDYYCYSLCREGSIALDGSNVIKDPSKHILHCLRDIPQCRSFYLAGNTGSGTDYRIKFKLDDSSERAALALVDSFKKGSAADGAPFQVTAVGLHNGDGYLRDAVLNVCNGTTCDSTCLVESGTCDTPADLDFTVKPGALLIMHVICMSLSWGCLLPLGVLWARNLRKHPKRIVGAPIWFQGHRILQSTGWLLQLLGLLFIFMWKKGNHFRFAHEILGLVVIAIGSLQPLNAQIRHLRCIGHPQPGETPTPARRAWEVMHKGLGYAAVILGIVNVILGPVHANNLRFDGALVVAAAIFIGLSLGILIIGGVALEIRRRLGMPELGYDEVKTTPENVQTIGATPGP